MSDQAPRIIAVTGATGAQGGGLARAILSDPDGGFAVRALTRNPDSDAARALAEQGAEVVRADLDEPETLRAAFEGAYGAFCVTNFWEHFSPARETQQARNLAEAAEAAGLEHVVWSTLEDTRERVPLDDDRMPTLQGSYKVPHFDSKGEADRFFHEADVPVTFLRTSFYWDNLIHFGMGPQRGEDGELKLFLPVADAKMPGIAAEDIGACAYGIFKEGPSLAGQYVGIAGEHVSGAEMAEGLGRVVGEDVTYVPLDFDAYRAFDFDGSEDLGNMFQYYVEFEEPFRAQRPVDRSRSLHPGLMSYDDWLERHGERIPVQ